MYGYREKRIAYFLPGTISVSRNSESAEHVLMTRTLAPQEVLTVDISVADSGNSGNEEGKSGITVSVDTSRIWKDDDCIVGDLDTDKGSEAENALSVLQAKSSAGKKDIWICGYIVGGDLSRSSISFKPPFASETNIAIAARSSVVSKESCLSVSLPAGKIRDALNLCDHPENLGRRVVLRGDIVESYFGITGVKNLSDFIMK